MRHANDVIAKMNELAGRKHAARHLIDRVSGPVCVQPNRYRFDLFEKGRRVESVEVVCVFGRLAEIESEVAEALRFPAAA